MLAALVNARLWWRVISGPGDDNPIGLVFVAGVLASGVPMLGFVVARRRGRPGLLVLVWLLASLLVLAVFLGWVLWVFGGGLW